MAKRLESLFVSAVALATCGVASALYVMEDDYWGGYTPRASSTFVNWETPQVHPIDMTPDGSKLLVCNTADARLEVFALGGAAPSSIGAVPVGIDPVTVRARTNTEVWVVNHISDSVSIIDLTTLNVVRTIKTLDEPCDVVFAGTPQRAFVSCSQVNTIQVWDPANLETAPVAVPVEAEDPRSLAVSPDGQTVYAAIFDSGNASTALGGGLVNAGTLAFPPNVVSNAAGPYGGVNPPPNNGAAFDPPLNAAAGTPPRVALIVKKNAAGQWMDDNNHNWTNMVSGAQASLSGRLPGWDLPDRDVAIINAGTLSVTYATGLMNKCMAVGVNPANGEITVVGTDATNEVRFEPVIKGTFLRVNLGRVDAASPAIKTIVDLNPHLNYAAPTLAQTERDRSVGDPRAIVWNSAGSRGFIAGMGSNNVVVVNAAGARAGLAETIEVGEGPTGICLDETRGQMYVLNRFAATISVVSLATELESSQVSYFDPTPASITTGRKHLYDTHKNSGLGQIACSSCHVDGRMDHLAWDLGDPAGATAPLTDLNLGFGVIGLAVGVTNPPFAPFHPMKGPMTTQTLQDIIDHEPHHWRGDRSGIEAFAPAFMGLQGDDVTLSPVEMQEFEDFLASITFPPNPFRNFDNSLPTNLPLTGHYKTGRFGGAGQPLPNGNAVNGLAIYRNSASPIDGGALSCVACHTLPTGMGPDMRLQGGIFQQIAPGPQGQRHLGLVSVDGASNVTMKIPQTRNMHEKTGFNTTQLSNSAGFGYLHDGSVDSIERFVSEPAFNVANDQQVADLVALMLAFSGSDLPAGSAIAPPFPTPPEPPGPPSKDTHAAVGQQTTLMNGAAPLPGQIALINSMIALANGNKVGVIVKGVQSGQRRGYMYMNGTGSFQADRAGETVTTATLQGSATPGSELTWTVVPLGAQLRMGIDRDADGVLDGDEVPPCGSADFNGDGDTGTDADIEAFFACLGGHCCPTCGSADFNGDGDTGTDADIEAFFRVLGGGTC